MTPFAEAAKSSPLVVIGRVKKWGKESMAVGAQVPYRMVVEVLKVVKGRERRRELVFQAFGGGVCEASIAQFPVSSTWAFALPKGNGDQALGLSQCLGQWLEIKTDADGRPIPGDLKRVQRLAKGEAGPS
jgi:hypothetical protein